MDFENDTDFPRIDIDANERQQRELVFELKRKRTLLDECKKELNEYILKVQDLERQLANEKRKNANDLSEKLLLQNATETLEDERQRISKDLVKLKVQLEMAVCDRDSLREQTKTLYIENINQKRQIEDLESKNSCHLSSQNNIAEQISRFKSAISQTNASMQALRTKQDELQQMLAINQNTEQICIVAKQFELQKNRAIKEKEELEYLLVTKSAEVCKLNEIIENSAILQQPLNYKSNILHWKTIAKDLQDQLILEKEGNFQLTNNLKLSNESQNILREKYSEASQKIEELESRLNKITSSVEVIEIDTQTDNFDDCEKLENQLNKLDGRVEVIEDDTQADNSKVIDEIDLIKSETE